jgi:hypothetical protein
MEEWRYESGNFYLCRWSEWSRNWDFNGQNPNKLNEAVTFLIYCMSTWQGAGCRCSFPGRRAVYGHAPL